MEPRLYGMCFRLTVCIPSYSGRSNGKTSNLTYLEVKNASWQIWLRIEIG